jgi:hypothetical protein
MSIKQRLTGKRISGSLITLSSAAIFAIYAAGYEQTKAAADRFAEQSAQRMASVPVAAAFEQAVAALPVEPASLNRAPETSSVSPVAPSTNSVPPLAAETNPSAAVNEVIASNRPRRRHLRRHLQLRRRLLPRHRPCIKTNTRTECIQAGAPPVTGISRQPS